MSDDLELVACTPLALDPGGFNSDTQLPYGCTVEHIYLGMNEFIDFLGFVNQQLHQRGTQRIETIMMPANFSSMVGEFVKSAIAKHCPGLVRNRYHNGHPDLIPAGRFLDDAVQHATEGIEVKASRYDKGWQGHNPEETWVMVLMFDSNSDRDVFKGIDPKPFHFKQVVGARLTEQDWSFAGRSNTSRRTITARVIASGYEKMVANWIYQAP